MISITSAGKLKYSSYEKLILSYFWRNTGLRIWITDLGLYCYGDLGTINTSYYHALIMAGIVWHVVAHLYIKNTHGLLFTYSDLIQSDVTESNLIWFNHIWCWIRLSNSKTFQHTDTLLFEYNMWTRKCVCIVFCCYVMVWVQHQIKSNQIKSNPWRNQLIISAEWYGHKCDKKFNFAD